MKVYQLNTYCGVKSTGRIAAQIASALIAEGGQCRIGYGVPETTPETEKISYRVGNTISRKFHGAIRKLADAEGYGNVAATIDLLKDIEGFRPDLIHLHNIHGCYLNHRILFHYLQKKQIPVVWTLHDCWPFTGHCAYFDAVNCQKWKSTCHHCEQLASYPCCVGMDGSSRNFRRKKRLFTSLDRLTLVAPCNWMAGKAKESFLKDADITVIPNGVDTSAFSRVNSDLRVQWAIKENRFILGVASDWDERKGLRYLIEASKRLGKNYCFAVIGLRGDQKRELPEHMLAISSVSNSSDLAKWYSAADCLANPTLEDNMPMVNLEALSCGTPVVAFDTGGCAQAIGNCGCVVPPKDVEEFCERIAYYSEQKEKISELCVQRASYFDVTHMTRAYLKLYEDLLS